MFAQFVILCSFPLLLLASGYLFTALMAVPHALSFPRLFTLGGLIGAGPQTTAWLYMIWHAGFPLAVIGFALLADGARVRRPWPSWASPAAVVLASVCGATLLDHGGPRPAAGHHAQRRLHADAACGHRRRVVAEPGGHVHLWRRPAKSVLDVWLMVVMAAWLFDIALSAVLNAGRFDLGFYVGRVFGLTGATLVLLVLLIETGAVYARHGTPSSKPK